MIRPVAPSPSATWRLLTLVATLGVVLVGCPGADDGENGVDGGEDSTLIADGDASATDVADDGSDTSDLTDAPDVADSSTEDVEDSSLDSGDTDHDVADDAADVAEDAEDASDVAEPPPDAEPDAADSADMAEVDTTDAAPVDAVDDTADGEDSATLCESLESAPVRVALGTGVRAWEPLIDGQEVLMAEGIQGGVHVWGALAGEGFGLLRNQAEFEIVAADGERIGALFSTGRFECNEEAEQLESAGLTVFINLDFDPMDLDGREATIHASLTTESGVVLRDERDVVLRCCDWIFGEP